MFISLVFSLLVVCISALLTSYVVCSKVISDDGLKIRIISVSTGIIIFLYIATMGYAVRFTG